MRPAIARYDGYSDWYDETFSATHPEEQETWFLETLGAGGGAVCLDIACGTGRAGRLLRDAGYRAVGFDISADQLRFARSRLPAAVRADARRLPVPDECADVATGMYFQTDTEDFTAVVREVARCLRPGGRFAYLGVHPCYVGPFVYRLDEQQDQSLTFTPGYGTPGYGTAGSGTAGSGTAGSGTAGSGTGGWADRGSGDGSKIGSRVGFHHKTLASFLQAFGDAGFMIRTVREFVPPGRILPWDLALLAEKPS
ncbi:MAG TPA: class I SAM-dependent methyltransferase [Streptosporangiaceae bacterium]|nr:class I SAM-dependent methyltransferase [Streptosporangiaceae bacterium]